MADPLETYRSKRDFQRTTEPAGLRRFAPVAGLRFVIQKHAATRLHYDFRLEWEGVLKSWAVTKGPSLDPRERRLAVEVEDHPLDYGDFEGRIPKGQYGGGTVMLWDRGGWEPEDGASPAEGFRKGHLSFRLDGEKLHGGWSLVRMRGREEEEAAERRRRNWLLIKHEDAFAGPGDPDAFLQANDRSVASGRTMEEIAEGVGPSPKPFITARQGSAGAVWDSDRDDPAPESAPRLRIRSDQGAVAPEGAEGRRRHARLRGARALQARGSATLRSGLGP